MAFRDRFESIEDFNEWLIAFYEERIIKYMDCMGEFTEHGTFISPALMKTTMKRYTDLLEKKYVIDRKFN